jgi:hypothetical protein
MAHAAGAAGPRQRLGAGRLAACYPSTADHGEQRAYLYGVGIPAEFLPTAGELSRTDLV